MTKVKLIEQLELLPHPVEGGYFKRTYEAEAYIKTENGPRKRLTSIYYMLTDDNNIGYLHKNASDIIHFFHCGSPCRYILVSPEGEISYKILGADLNKGQQLQLLVPGGYWKASELTDGEYGLISEVVSPGFDYADNTLASTKDLNEITEKDLTKYIKPQ